MSYYGSYEKEYRDQEEFERLKNVRNRLQAVTLVETDVALDETRNSTTERITATDSDTMEFYHDDETGQCRMRLSKAQDRVVLLGASSVAIQHIDPDMMARFVVTSVAHADNEMIGDQSRDKNNAGLYIEEETIPLKTQ
jgi:hypothetical protein